MSAEVSYSDVSAALRERGRFHGKVNPKEYHAWKDRLAAEFGCPVVSKSGLHDFAKSPYRYRYNQLHDVHPEGRGLLLGSMVDCKVLTPALWGDMFAEPWKPEGKYAEPWVPWVPKEEWKPKMKKDGTPGKQQDPDQKAAWDAAKEQDKLAKEAFEQEKAELKAAFEADCAARGITIVKHDDVELSEAVAAQATDHLASLGLVRDVSFASQVAMWVYVDELEGVKLATPLIVTGMIDILPLSGGSIMDLKTTSADVNNAEKLFYAMEDFRYGVQAALYLDLYNQCTGDARDSFSFLFVNTSFPAMSREVYLTPADVEMYRRDYMNLLRRYALACANDEWGEATLDAVYYQPTRREAGRFNRMMQEG